MICDEDAERAAQEIGEPVVEIISGAAWGEGLVVFIDGTEDAEKDDGKKIASDARGDGAVFQQQPCGEDNAASEEISEVGDFIEVRNFRGFDGEFGVKRGSNAKCGQPQNEH